jgi:ferredoxin
MRGILQGLGLTLSHLTRPKVTRLYPYEKRKLPPRSRGLIQLIQEEGQDTPFNLKCEACLLCEKACPPRAITIETRPTFRFRRRPYFSPTSVAGYYTPRFSEYAVDYANKPLSPPVLTPVAPELEEGVDLSKADAILDRASLDAWDLTAVLDELMDTYDGMPISVAWRVVERWGVDISDIFGIVTASQDFKPARPKAGGVLRADQMERGPSQATRGKYGNINHRRAPRV